MYWGCMERLDFTSHVVSLSIYDMYGATAYLGLKYYGLQEYPKLPTNKNIHEVPLPRTQVLQMALPT